MSPWICSIFQKEFRNKKKPLVIIAGCVAQAEGDIILKKEKYIDAVVGPQSYHKINQIILNLEIRAIGNLIKIMFHHKM